MTSRFYINTNQNEKNIPVYIEQGTSRFVYRFKSTDTPAIRTLLNDDEKESFDKNRRFNELYFEEAIKSWYTIINIYSFWATILQFKSKVKGVIKLRQITASDFVLNDELFLYIHKLVSYDFVGITWSVEAITLAIEVLKEQNNKWLRVKNKYDSSDLNTQLIAFIKLATGQQDFYYSNKICLYIYLDLLPTIIGEWEDMLASKVKPVTVDNNLFKNLYFNLYGRTKQSFRIGALGFLFKEIKKPLENLLLTFTKNSIELKFLGYKK